MKNELQVHKKNDKIKWIFTAIAFALISVIIMGLSLQVFGKGNAQPSKWFKPETEQSQNDDNGEIVIGESNNNCVQLLSARIEPMSYAEYGISEHADSAYQITASIYPAEASLQSGTFSIGFKNPSSSWASGKNINDYAAVTQKGLTATFVCKQAFGEQILLTFTADAFEGETPVTATCNIDYCSRVTGVSVFRLCGDRIGYDLEGYEFNDLAFMYDFVGSDTDSLDFLDHTSDEDYSVVNAIYGVGSVHNLVNSSISLKLADDMVSIIQGITGVVPSIFQLGDSANFKTAISAIIGGNFMSDTAMRNSLVNVFNSKFKAGEATFIFELVFTNLYTGSVSVVEVPAKFNHAEMGIRTTSSTLNENNLFV